MPRAYSNDLRERVVAAAGRGLSASGAARVFGVSISTAIRWTRRVRDTGSAAAKPCGGDTRSKLTDHATWLMELIRQQPDLTLTEIQQRLRADRAILVGYGTVWRFFASRKISFKKTGSDRGPACSGRNGPRYCGVEGSGRQLFGGSVPVKKRGPWAVADLPVVTLSSDPD
jgi:transposase